MLKQYGFYFDESRCVRCRTCEIACKVTNNVEYGVFWRKVIDSWEGTYPDIKHIFFSKACMHCGDPLCAAACPESAISKRNEDGIVVVDSEKCDGCKVCLDACPFDIPQFGSDGKMQKCDFCVSAGTEPACTQSCPAEAIFSGPMDELLKKAGNKKVRRLEEKSVPSILIIG